MSFKPGDLVMVVKPTTCCGDAASVGNVLTVESYARDVESFCQKCAMHVTTISALVLVGGGYVVDEHRLIKIDPLTEQDKIETLQEITA